MAEEIKCKSIEVSAKAVDVDGERRITFVASSNGLDRHDERVDVKSLRLPLKTGGYAVVGDIPSSGIEGVDVPLMLNHSADVVDVIGSVRKAFFINDELVFEAGISKREIAQEVLTLMEEDHLSNAFSITMTDFAYQDNTIYDAEVIEVSVVFRGANKEARLLAIKSLLGGDMPEEQKAEAEVAETVTETEKVEVEETEAEATEVVEEQTEAEEAEPVEAEAEAEETVEPAVEEEAEEAETEEKAQEETNNEEIMEKEIAKEAIVAPVAKSVASSDYLSSKKALVDFKNTVLKYHRGSNEQIMKEWTDSLKEKAISGDAILPSRIENIFFKAWADNTGIVGTFRQLNIKTAGVYAMAGDTNPNAKGHTKGSSKVDQTIEAIRRDIKALCIYKKLPIDLQDLFDDETGELLAFRVEELADRILHAIAVGAITGSATETYISSGRGLNAMKTDLDNIGTDDYAATVATVVTADASDTILDKAIKTLGAVKSEGNRRKVLIVPEGFRTEVALLKNANGYYLVNDPEEFLNCRIFELSEVDGSGYDMYAYVEDYSYVLVGEQNASVRTDFDLTTNQDIMLQERYVGGSAQGYKAIAGYPSEES